VKTQNHVRLIFSRIPDALIVTETHPDLPPVLVTADMCYLIYRELLAPLDDWAKAVESARNQFVGKHGLAMRTSKFQRAGYRFC